MKPTEIVYSSHDRCEHLHRDWIVERALEAPDDKTILYLPVSSGSRGDQEYSVGTFSSYFDRFRAYGLEPRYFYWDDSLGPDDARRFFDWLIGSQVVILGGGRTSTGLKRYRAIGEILGNGSAFLEVLRERHNRGKLTAGFSAGADQLSEWSCDDGSACLGIVRKVVVRLHFGPGDEGAIADLARRNPDGLAFGLPNDSGLAVNEGTTGRGRVWQHIQLISDSSWDRPEDAHHIKTRWGVKIEHRYADGREWKFNGGDTILRVFSPDGGAGEIFIKRPEIPVFFDYWTQRETWYPTVESILVDR